MKNNLDWQKKLDKLSGWIGTSPNKLITVVNARAIIEEVIAHHESRVKDYLEAYKRERRNEIEEDGVNQTAETAIDVCDEILEDLFPAK